MYEIFLIILIAICIFVIFKITEQKKYIHNKLESISAENAKIKQDLDEYRKNMLEIQHNNLKTNEEMLEVLKKIEVSLQNQNK